ncbi:phage portal protein [Tissierella sp.]|uniref:phage portal protein n=1 Tax=Tissierella sp. TaxID=41274 RepID=UPI0028AA866D|nr:phage portal protein [Tissierella sp.]
MKVDKELILRCLKELRKNQVKYKVYKNYFDGNMDILRNYAMNESRSNQKVVVNFFKKFINDEIAYAIGNPISYISTVGDNDLISTIDLNFGYWSKVHDQELLKQANIFGESYELHYISESGDFKATVYNPLQMFVLESGNAEKEVELAIQIYKENIFSENEMIDVYYGNVIEHYQIIDDETIKLTGRNTHIFDKPPIVVCSANTERKSMLDNIKSENDAFNTVLSDYVNEISDFRNALLKITGAELLDENELKEMKRVGAIQVPASAEVSYLIKNMEDSFIQNSLTTLEDKIYKLASHIDTNEKLQSNLSGTALRSRMIALENKCLLMQSMIELVIKKRLKNFFEYLRITKGQEYDYRTIKLKLTMNIPSDVNLIADTISKLRGLASDETLLSLLPFVENPQIELEKRRKEELKIDLDDVDYIANKNNLGD